MSPERMPGHVENNLAIAASTSAKDGLNSLERTVKVAQNFTAALTLFTSNEGIRIASELFDQIPKLQKEKEENEKELKDADTKLKRVIKESAEKLEEAEKTHKQKTQANLDAYDAAKERFEQEKKELKDSIEKFEMSDRKNKKKIQDLEKQEEELKTGQHRLEENLKAKAFQLKTKEKECEKLKNTVEALRRKDERVAEDITALRKDKDRKENDLKNCEKDNIHLHEELKRTQERLEEIQTFSVNLNDKEDPALVAADVEKLWASAATLVNKYFAQSLPDEVLQRKWTKLNDCKEFMPSISTPLPQTNTHIAKQLRSLKVLGVLACLIDKHLFQPSYHLVEETRFKELLFRLANTEPEKERFLRGIMLSIFRSDSEDSEAAIDGEDSVIDAAKRAFLRDAGVDELIAHEAMGAFEQDLMNLFYNAVDIWQAVRHNRANITPCFDYVESEGKKWVTHEMKTSTRESEGKKQKQASNEKTAGGSRNDNDDDIIVLFPKIYTVGRGEWKALTAGTIVRESHIKAAFREEPPSQPAVTLIAQQHRSRQRRHASMSAAGGQGRPTGTDFLDQAGNSATRSRG